MSEERHPRQRMSEERQRAAQAFTAARRLVQAELSFQAAQEQDRLPGHLCEVCLDAPAVHLQPAPWGGEMGVCTTCQT